MNLWGGGRPTPALSVEVEAIARSRRWLRPFDPLALGEQRSGSERLLPKLLVFKTVVLVPRCSLLLSLRGLCRRDLLCGCEPQTPQMR